MKKIISIFLIATLVSSMASCKNDQISQNPPNESVQELGKVEPEYTAKLYVDFTCGASDLILEQYELGYSGDLTPEILLNGLSALTGLDFFADVEMASNGIYVDWKKASTLIANLDDRTQNEHFFFFDSSSMRWFMLDSLFRTLLENFKPPEVYYTMDGGKALAFDELYPAKTFGLDMPYMGSSYYYANDGRGDIFDDSISETPWEGAYMNADETKSLHIVNFNGTSFFFEFETIDGLNFKETAEVDGDLAYYMDLVFAISIRGDDVSVWIDEPKDGSAERESYKDTYFRGDTLIFNEPVWGHDEPVLDD